MGRIGCAFGIFSFLLLAGCKMDVAPPDPCSCTSADRVDCIFTVPGGLNIHEVTIVVDTNDATVNSVDLTYTLTHDGATAPRTFFNNANTNFTWDLSTETGSALPGTVLVETAFSSCEITLTFYLNPKVTAGSYGSIPSTQDWTFSVTGLSGQDVKVSASAIDTLSNPVSITCQCICS